MALTAGQQDDPGRNPHMKLAAAPVASARTLAVLYPAACKELLLWLMQMQCGRHSIFPHIRRHFEVRPCYEVELAGQVFLVYSTTRPHQDPFGSSPLSWDLLFFQVTPGRKPFVLACSFRFRAHANECLFTENWNCCPLFGGEDGRCMRMHNDNHSAKGAMQVASVVSSKLTYSACPSPRKAKQARPRASTKRGCRHQAAPLLHRCAAHRCTSLRSNGSQAQDVRRMCARCVQDVWRICAGPSGRYLYHAQHGIRHNCCMLACRIEEG